ncbi:MAG TPA: replicative DNA helicase, partial [Candidatus Kryptobacter bacterium]|nr:MAG: replicative DNA helicase [Ignavibacteriae bacterium 37-53-5]HQT90764.1 replicative DNA helicase [Candidatus Kryptobacter bacterium]
MLELYTRNVEIDVITVREELRRTGHLENIGGSAYLNELVSSVVSSANVEAHAQIVAEKYMLRSLITTMSQNVQKCYDNREDAFGLIDEVERDIFRVSEARLKKAVVPLQQALVKTMEVLERIHGSKGGVTGVPTGFTDLDSMTGGLQKSDLIIIAARPSVGKTAFALSIARNAAVKFGVPTAVYSLEMSQQQLLIRLLAAEARVDAHALRTGTLPEEKWAYISTRIHKLAPAPIFIDDTPALSVLELRARSRRLKSEHDIGLIMVDYLQLMQGPARAESREREISMISRSLKVLAKELDIPVIALSQLRRSVEERNDKRPILSDLRESGALEQDADVVIFIHRPELYGIESYPDGESTQGVAEVMISKQRNGPTGDIRLAFVKQYARFEDLSKYPTGPSGAAAEPDEKVPF